MQVAISLGLTSLADRRHIAGIKFLAGLLNNNIDSSALKFHLIFLPSFISRMHPQTI